MTGYYSADTLAHLLTDQYNSEADKVGAIVHWIAEHISYDVKGYHEKEALYPGIVYTADNELYNKRKADIVINRQKGVCEGYAAVFKVLCDYAHLKAEIIEGIGRLYTDTIGEFILPNHAWNAVNIDGRWQLLDLTWISGYADEAITKYTRRFNDYYLFTPPEKMILNHFPSVSKWTLLSKPPTLLEFFNSPLILGGFPIFEVSSFKPRGGIIETHVGDTIKIELETKELHKGLAIIDNLDKMIMTGYDDPGIKVPMDSIINSGRDENIPLDTAALRLITKQITRQDRQFSDDILGYVNSVEDSDSANVEKPTIHRGKPKVNPNINGDRIFLKYVVRSTKAKELILEYNYYPVLKYKLRIKPHK